MQSPVHSGVVVDDEVQRGDREIQSDRGVNGRERVNERRD
jgi:hypothetical protein